MPLPPEMLEDIKRRIDESEDALKVVEDVIADLRAAGTDASQHEERLKAAKEELRRLRMFYERQTARIKPSE